MAICTKFDEADKFLILNENNALGSFHSDTTNVCNTHEKDQPSIISDASESGGIDEVKFPDLDRENKTIEMTAVNDPATTSSIVKCEYCNLNCPIRSHHCKDCDKCVATFDHHCYVIGTCIGERNHCSQYHL